MAQKVLVQMVDDLDGAASDDVSTVSFGLDGAEYEIDLGSSNAENLRDLFEGYIAVARRVGGRKRRTVSASNGSASNGEAALIREWALENGHELSARGRIPGKVVEAYNEAKAASAKSSTRKAPRKKK